MYFYLTNLEKSPILMPNRAGVLRDMDSASMIKATEKFITTIAQCLSDAVGDDIRADVKRNGLVTENGSPTRKWDYLNTHLCEKFDQKTILARPTKRGAWAMVPIVDKDAGFIYTIMREERFIQLKKKRPKRRNAHYVDALAQTFNIDLHGRQGDLFEGNPVQCFDNTNVHSIVQGIFRDLRTPCEVVRRHALILFSSSNHILTALHCYIIDSKWEIVQKADWRNYIASHESNVVEEIHDPDSTNNLPALGLQFTQKAKDRLGQKRATRIKKARKKKKED